SGISENTIVTVINHEPGKYRLTDADAVLLKNARVSEDHCRNDGQGCRTKFPSTTAKTSACKWWFISEQRYSFFLFVSNGKAEIRLPPAFYAFREAFSA